jgi:hypothetical protein
MISLGAAEAVDGVTTAGGADTPLATGLTGASCLGATAALPVGAIRATHTGAAGGRFVVFSGLGVEFFLLPSLAGLTAAFFLGPAAHAFLFRAALFVPLRFLIEGLSGEGVNFRFVPEGGAATMV